VSAARTTTLGDEIIVVTFADYKIRELRAAAGMTPEAACLAAYQPKPGDAAVKGFAIPAMEWPEVEEVEEVEDPNFPEGFMWAHERPDFNPTPDPRADWYARRGMAGRTSGGKLTQPGRGIGDELCWLVQRTDGRTYAVELEEAKTAVEAVDCVRDGLGWYSNGSCESADGYRAAIAETVSYETSQHTCWQDQKPEPGIVQFDDSWPTGPDGHSPIRAASGDGNAFVEESVSDRTTTLDAEIIVVQFLDCETRILQAEGGLDPLEAVQRAYRPEYDDAPVDYFSIPSMGWTHSPPRFTPDPVDESVPANEAPVRDLERERAGWSARRGLAARERSGKLTQPGRWIGDEPALCWLVLEETGRMYAVELSDAATAADAIDSAREGLGWSSKDSGESPDGYRGAMYATEAHETSRHARWQDSRPEPGIVQFDDSWPTGPDGHCPILAAGSQGSDWLPTARPQPGRTPGRAAAMELALSMQSAEERGQVVHSIPLFPKLMRSEVGKPVCGLRINADTGAWEVACVVRTGRPPVVEFGAEPIGADATHCFIGTSEPIERWMIEDPNAFSAAPAHVQTRPIASAAPAGPAPASAMAAAFSALRAQQSEGPAM